MSAQSKYGGDRPIRQRVFWSFFDSRKSPVKGCESGNAEHGQESCYLQKSAYDWLFASAVFPLDDGNANFQPMSTVGIGSQFKALFLPPIRTCLGTIPGAATTSKTALLNLSADVVALSAVEVYRESLDLDRRKPLDP